MIKDLCKFTAAALVLISGAFIGALSGYLFLSFLVGLI
jgi:hypothetical protein